MLFCIVYTFTKDVISMPPVIRTSKNKYWLTFEAAGHCECPYEGDGFWMAFIRKNITRIDAAFPERVKRFLVQYEIEKARLSLPLYDRLLVFTGCDKLEICRVKAYIQETFGVKSEHLIWKANFESDADWEGSGWLNQLSDIFHLYEKKAPENIPWNLRQIAMAKSKMYQTIFEDYCRRRTAMIVRPVFGNIDYSIEPGTIFVLMPFCEPWSKDLYCLLQNAAALANMKIRRVDDIFEPGVITADIWKMINAAQIVIADITVHNANVFYELGIAHTLGKNVIITKAHGGAKPPFDIQMWRYFEYGLSLADARQCEEDLAKVIRSCTHARAIV